MGGGEGEIDWIFEESSRLEKGAAGRDIVVEDEDESLDVHHFLKRADEIDLAFRVSKSALEGDESGLLQCFDNGHTGAFGESQGEFVYGVESAFAFFACVDGDGDDRVKGESRLLDFFFEEHGEDGIESVFPGFVARVEFGEIGVGEDGDVGGKARHVHGFFDSYDSF